MKPGIDQKTGTILPLPSWFPSPSDGRVVRRDGFGEGQVFAAPEWIGSFGLSRLRPRRRGEGTFIPWLAEPEPQPHLLRRPLKKSSDKAVRNTKAWQSRSRSVWPSSTLRFQLFPTANLWRERVRKAPPAL